MNKQSLRAGANKILVKEFKTQSTSPITIPDSLKEMVYKVVEVGFPKTTFDNKPNMVRGDLIRILPNTGYDLELEGDKYKVVNYEDVLVAFEKD